MKTLVKLPVPLLFFLSLFLGSCNKDDEKSATYDLICGKWEVTEIQFDVTIGGQSFTAYLINTYGFTEQEADLAAEENEKAYKDTWTGTMDYKEDGTYEFNVGGEYYSNDWYLSDDEKTIHVYITGHYMDFKLISVNEITMKLCFDQVYYYDINDDGIKDAIDYTNDFTLEK